jgi:uncharacterized membrane protein YkvI
LLKKAFRVLIIPAGVVLSTMFGGGYASGREVATFVSGYGPWGGVLAAITLGLVFGVTLVVCFELARLFRAYEYAGFSRLLLGRAVVVYEIALMVFLYLALTVAATAAGSILEDHFGVPQLLGTAVLLVSAIALTYYGRRVVELSMTLTAGLLVALLVGLIIVVFRSEGESISSLFREEPMDWAFWQGGGRYGVLAAAAIPVIIFIARNIETRREAVASGLFAGAITALPALAFHLAFLGSYPAVLDEEVPSYAIAEAFGGPAFLDIFVIVIFILIAQTAVGVVQGLNERIDVWVLAKRGRVLGAAEHAGVSTVVLLGTVVLSTVGLVTLVASGYGLLSLVFVATFTIPVFTVGLWRTWGGGRPPVADVDRGEVQPPAS